MKCSSKNNMLDEIKLFFAKQVTNSSHTLSADIKELFATNIMSIAYYLKYILPQRNELKRTKELKNTKKGKKCFVFANGPSMNLLDIRKIERYQKSGFDVICVNSYIISEMAKTVIPDYYVLSDPVSFGASNNAVSDDIINAQKRQLFCLNNLNIPVFIPAQFSHDLIKNYYIFNDFENRFSKNIDPLKPRGYFTLTAYKALAIACYLGYETIYICGFDNDYFKMISVDENNVVYYNNKHFYDDGEKTKAISSCGNTISDLFWDNYLIFKQLELFNNYNIINLNKTGFVDAFSKKHNIDVYESETRF